MDDENLELERELRRAAQLEWPRNLRSTSIHEFAHLHVAKHFGHFGCVQIVINPDGNGPNQKFFAGQFNMVSSEDVDAKRIIGLAGSCAEELDADPETAAENILRQIANGEIELSASDAAMAGEFDHTHVEECLTILRVQWLSILRGADRVSHVPRELRCAGAIYDY